MNLASRRNRKNNEKKNNKSRRLYTRKGGAPEPAEESLAPIEPVVLESAVPETVAPESVTQVEAVDPETVAPETVALETVAPEIVAPETLSESVTLVESEPVMEFEPVSVIPNMLDKQKRCPKGMRRNKKTGECASLESTNTSNILDLEIPQTVTESSIEQTLPSIIETVKKRCPKGTRRNKKTGACEPVESNNTTKKVQSKAKQVDIPILIPQPVSMIDVNESVRRYDQLQDEKQQYDYNAENTEYDFLYPEINDPNFNVKIAKRKEFNDTKYDGTVHDIKKQANILCNAQFELMPHQLFIKNFLSFQTPYNSLLLYHALGSGKTCSAIGVAEEMRNYMKQVGIKPRIIVVASPNVQHNFRLQLFDERKLELIHGSATGSSGLWNIESCIGNTLINEINPTQMKGLSRDKVINHVRRIINNYYLFMGYGQLANYISNSIKINDASELPAEIVKKQEMRKIQQLFNNRLIIIDEIHNIRISDDNTSEKKKTANLLMKVAKHAENMRLLLLSATPMFNSYKEIVWLTNLMNVNDKRASIEISDIFDKDGNFKPSHVSTAQEQLSLINAEMQRRKTVNEKTGEGGKELLIRKLTGYVSYVRGENPYSFPFRVYPKHFSPEHTFLQNKYPEKQMNDTMIDSPLKYVNVYNTRIGSYQAKGYNYIMNYMKNKSYDIYNKYGNVREMPNFENMESFGYTLLQTPLEALNIVYPSEALDISDTEIENEEEDNQKQTITEMIGKNGMSHIMKYTEETQQSIPLRYNFEYKPNILKKYGPIFNSENIHKYSAKIAEICNAIRTSKGIVLVYSQYIDGGIVPIALALEEMGFSRFGTSSQTKNLFKKKRTEDVDAISMKPRKETTGEVFYPAKYVMITGEKAFSPNNAEDIKYITSMDNSNGEKVKVVLISKAGAEGLDFKCVRQVHILDPWYNMNRIEQIIGRGVRNLSHCRLPFEDRNVEIYLHTTILDNQEEEAADLYVYRLAERKALQIGKITRILKETSVDCILNVGQTNFTAETLMENAANQNIDINLSSGKIIDFKIGDQPFTDICDYMDTCSYKCLPDAQISNDDIIGDTYNNTFVQMNQSRILSRILQLFREQNVYKRTQLIDSINIVKQYPIEQIFSALTFLIDNKNEFLVDKYGRYGNLINKGEYYVFQPLEITDENISMLDRTVPIEYKRKSIFLKYNNEIVDEKEDVKTAFREPDQMPEKTEKTWLDIKIEINENMGHIFAGKRLVKGEKDWYKHAALVLSELRTQYGFNDDAIRHYMMDHILDMLLFEDKMILVKHFYGENVKPVGVYEELVKKYLDKRIVQSDNYMGILLMKDDELKIYVKSDMGEWAVADSDDYQLFITDLVKNNIQKSRMNTIIGFVNLFVSKKSNQKEMVFKIKDLKQKRNNKGARCDDAGKEKIVKLLNMVLESTKYDDENTEFISQLGLCVILEMIMRERSGSNRGKVYFLSPEQTAITEIVKYSMA